MFVYVCLFFSLCLESIFLKFKVNSASILSYHYNLSMFEKSILSSAAMLFYRWLVNEEKKSCVVCKSYYLVV